VPASPHSPVVYVWSYVVKPEHVAAFREAYGPSGAWARYFAQSDGYLGTELLESLAEPGRFVTIDTFSTPDAREALIAATRERYAALDSKWAEATESETFLGAFRIAP
jgi:hypothetical protein